jgi:exopolyphosphatase/pppGpp-phosphohydrolase
MDRLTFLLVERGKLTQAQMDYALANLKPGLSIGKNLIEMGFITQRDLLEVARAQVERLVERLAALPLASRARLPGMEPKRADVIVAGAVVVAEAMALTGFESLTVSDRGVRWGLVYEAIARLPG